MKLLLFFIFVLYSTPCLGQIPQDKLLHAGGCYAISATTSSVMYNITGNRKKSLIYVYLPPLPLVVLKKYTILSVVIVIGVM